jgi:hypothetical protein
MKQFFMDNITNYLNLPENAKVLIWLVNRHSIYLNQLGRCFGADLSENSIAEASKDTTLAF